MAQLEKEDTLPFSEVKQRALLGYLLTDERFFLQARGKLDPAWFFDGFASRVYSEKLKFYKTYGRVPSVAELKEVESFLKEEPRSRNKYYATMSLACAEMAHFGLDVLRKELTNWMRSRHYAKHLDRSVKLFNNQNFEASYEEIGRIDKEIAEIVFDNDMEVNFDDTASFIRRRKEEVQKGDLCTFGSRLVDQLLLPEAKGWGSLRRGDTTILLAPTNIGKTTTMITVIVHNILRGKHILFLTHEGSEDDIREKLTMCLLNVDKQTLYSLYETDAGMKRLAGAERALRNLTYVPYNKAGGTVEEVESIIRHKQDQHLAKHSRGFDMLACDYPAKLTTNQAKNGNLQYRHIEQIVYNVFVQLALELKLHALLIVQTNREGSRKNRGHKSKWDDTGESHRLLQMEDVAENFGSMQIATNVISINRDERAMAKDVITFYICKSRSNETGWAIVCRSNYKNARTHSDKLGGVFYQSSQTMSDRVESFLANYNNSLVPRDVLLQDITV